MPTDWRTRGTDVLQANMEIARRMQDSAELAARRDMAARELKSRQELEYARMAAAAGQNMMNIMARQLEIGQTAEIQALRDARLSEAELQRMQTRRAWDVYDRTVAETGRTPEDLELEEARSGVDRRELYRVYADETRARRLEQENEYKLKFIEQSSDAQLAAANRRIADQLRQIDDAVASIASDPGYTDQEKAAFADAARRRKLALATGIELPSPVKIEDELFRHDGLLLHRTPKGELKVIDKPAEQSSGSHGSVAMPRVDMDSAKAFAISRRVAAGRHPDEAADFVTYPMSSEELMSAMESAAMAQASMQDRIRSIMQIARDQNIPFDVASRIYDEQRRKQLDEINLMILREKAEEHRRRAIMAPDSAPVPQPTAPASQPAPEPVASGRKLPITPAIKARLAQARAISPQALNEVVDYLKRAGYDVPSEYDASAPKPAPWWQHKYDPSALRGG